MQVGFLSIVHTLKQAAHKLEDTTQHDQSQPDEMPRDNLKQLSIKLNDVPWSNAKGTFLLF